MTAALRALRAFPAMLRVGLAEMVAYRAELFIWFLTSALPLIMLLVWDRVAEGGHVGRFDRPGFARYFAMALVVRHFTTAWVVWELNSDIRTGRLSPALLKPVNPLLYPAATNLAAMPFRLFVLVPMVALIWWWRPDMGIGFGLAELPLLLLSVALGWAITYLVQVVFGSLAFFLEQSIGLFQVWFGLWALLSGYLAPVELMPPAVRAVAWYLPFRASFGVPVEIAAGLLRGGEAVAAVGMQVGWLAAAGLLARWVWRAGVRRYEAYGA